MPTISSVLEMAVVLLADVSETPRLDAECLLAHALDSTRTSLVAWPEKALQVNETRRFDIYLMERMQGIPVAYITGEREFWSLPFRVTEATLIPRPETETLIEWLLGKFPPDMALDVIDMGTGSGAIACALAAERPGWKISATDISTEALAVANLNATRNTGADIDFLQSNWFEHLEGRTFDIVVSNPPYVPERDPHLQQGDVRYEPSFALRSGSDGLDDIRILTREAPAHLKAGGWLVIEHGYDQKPAVRQLFEAAGFNAIEQHNDLAGRPRLTAGRHR